MTARPADVRAYEPARGYSLLMRLGVADVGSNTVRLVIAEGDGGLPLPVHTSKRRLHLAEQVSTDGRLAADAVECLVEALAGVKEEALWWKVGEPLVLATAAVRDAVNCQEIVAAVRARTGLSLHVMSGVTEAELTFLAVRQWMGWRAGSMALLDIGGGSLEVAFGRGRTPDFAVSLPLGAGRLTREYLDQDSAPAPEVVKQVRRRVRHELRDAAARIQWERPRTAVATSRTFHQLGRLCGAAPRREGPLVPRQLSRSDLKAALKTLVVCLHDDRVAGLVDAPPVFEQAGEEAARPQLRDRELEVAGLCGHRLLAVTVAPGGAGVGVFAPLGADTGSVAERRIMRGPSACPANPR